MDPIRELQTLVTEYATVKHRPNPRWIVEQYRYESLAHYKEFYDKARAILLPINVSGEA
jgi:hypothetical protein